MKAEDLSARVAAIVRAHREMPGALLPVLHRIQEEFGYIGADMVPVIASELNLSRAEVHGVISFYHDFRSAPAGRHIIRLCQAESCQAVGATALASYARQRLGIDFGQTTDDGKFTLLPVYCLGNCACSPAMSIDDSLHGRLDPSGLEQAISALEKS
jgi:formate dehydrogenase subunit gamma